MSFLFLQIQHGLHFYVNICILMLHLVNSRHDVWLKLWRRIFQIKKEVPSCLWTVSSTWTQMGLICVDGCLVARLHAADVQRRMWELRGSTLQRLHADVSQLRLTSRNKRSWLNSCRTTEENVKSCQFHAFIIARRVILVFTV